MNIDRSLDDVMMDANPVVSRALRGGPRQTGGRSHPYRRSPGRQDNSAMETDRPQGRIGDELDVNITFPPGTIKVGAQKEAREIAEGLSRNCRSAAGGELPAVLTIGNSSINQAVKAIAITAAEFSQGGTMLTFQPAFRHTDKTKPFIAFYLSSDRSRRQNTAGEAQLTVTAGGRPAVIAGAIAGKVREGMDVCLSAVGVDAVTNAVLAVGHARLYLEDDQLDIKVHPMFAKEEKNGNSLTVMKMLVTFERL